MKSILKKVIIAVATLYCIQFVWAFAMLFISAFQTSQQWDLLDELFVENSTWIDQKNQLQLTFCDEGYGVLTKTNDRSQQLAIVFFAPPGTVGFYPIDSIDSGGQILDYDSEVAIGYCNYDKMQGLVILDDFDRKAACEMILYQDKIVFQRAEKD